MKKNQFDILKEEFQSECKVINLKYEYKGYSGKEQWAIVTELSEKELLEKYAEELKSYIPFVLLSEEQGKVIFKSRRNDQKHKMRKARAADAFSYEDGVIEYFHKELISYTDPVEEKEAIQEEQEKERLKALEIEKVRTALSLLKPIQRDRLVKNVCLNLSSRKIALQEGVNYSSVDKSIHAAKKNFKKIYETL